MMRAIVLAAVSLAGAAPGWGQFAVFAANDSTRVGNELQVGNIPAGDSVTVPLKLRNISGAPANVTLLQVSGMGFAAERVPPLPRVLAAEAEIDFAVRFEPAVPGAYSASLRADSLSVILVGSATPAPAVTVAEDGGWRTLASGMTVDFGDVERGAEAKKRFTVTNRNREALPPMDAAVEGDGFRLSGAAAVVLGPGESAAFDVVFAPAEAGVREGALRVGQRRFLLRATGVEPPLPRPEIVVDLPEARSARQGRVSVRFAGASRGRGEGELRIGFEPAGPTGADPGIVFLSGGRNAPFSVEEGDTEVRFGAGRDVAFQTGSTAGTLVFTVGAGPWRERKEVVLGPEPVGVSSCRASRGTSSVDVTLSGYDNTRSASQLTFTFYDGQGKAVQPGAIRVDGSASFRQYFETSALGGVFLLRAVFPVSGAAEGIEAVEAEVSNAAGAARTGRVRF